MEVCTNDKKVFRTNERVCKMTKKCEGKGNGTQ